MWTVTVVMMRMKMMTAMTRAVLPTKRVLAAASRHDGDGVIDGEDDDPNDPTVCSDTDTDGCDDCYGTYDPANDDTDSDGQCNDVDDDDDGNGVNDAEEGCLTDNLLTNGGFETNAGINGGQLSGYPK